MPTPKNETVEIIIDGSMQECEVTIDENGETVCEVTSGDSKGRFVKFPKGANLIKSVKEHNVNHDIKESEDEE